MDMAKPILKINFNGVALYHQGKMTTEEIKWKIKSKGGLGYGGLAKKLGIPPKRLTCLLYTSDAADE